jgi:hypothetical protein
MSLSDDVDVEQLIARLAGPLAPLDRDAFRAAAKAAIEQIPCAGEGLVYRIVSEVWRAYFHPPTDRETGHHPFLPGSRRLNKLSDGSPIGRDDPRTGGRDRRRLKLVG